MNGSLPTSSTSAAFPPSNGFDENSLSNLNPDDHNNMQHHFGRTGLGAVKFGSQLSKIESEMYTDNFSMILMLHNHKMSINYSFLIQQQQYQIYTMLLNLIQVIIMQVVIQVIMMSIIILT